MSDIPFIIDSGDKNVNYTRLLYVSVGSIENGLDNASSKPSQERPAILKQKLKRYHETDKKFIPGMLSKELRNALGLGFSDIPNHIYRMRKFGYPPGWLKRAEVVSSNITITGANAVVNKSNDNSVKFDVGKLYEYPGFNTYNNYDYRYDYCRQLGHLPMQRHQILDNVLIRLSGEHRLGRVATDMADIRSTNVICKDTDFNLPITTSMTSGSAQSRRRRKSSSMELSDMEVDEDDCDGSDREGSVAEEREEEEEDGGVHDPRIEEGTCLLVPVVEKPTLASFSEGINELRLHENLPDAGGHYRRVLSVLKRIQA